MYSYQDGNQRSEHDKSKPLRSLDGGVVVPPGKARRSPQAQKPSPSSVLETDIPGDFARDAGRRQRDIQTLREMMSFVHIPTIDQFVDDLGNGYVPRKIMIFHAGFEEVVASSLFHIYDRELASRVIKFRTSWNASLSFGAYFFRAGDDYSFHSGGGSFTSKERAVLEEIQEAARGLRAAFRELLNYIHEHYMDIDLAQTSAAAWRGFLKVEEDVKAMLARPLTSPTASEESSNERPNRTVHRSVHRSARPPPKRRK